MAPEQIDRTLGEIGPTTDVYGLGALLLMLCCGHPPHQGGSVSEIIERVVQSTDDLPLGDVSEFVPHPVRRNLAALPVKRLAAPLSVGGRGGHRSPIGAERASTPLSKDVDRDRSPTIPRPSLAMPAQRRSYD